MDLWNQDDEASGTLRTFRLTRQLVREEDRSQSSLDEEDVLAWLATETEIGAVAKRSKVDVDGLLISQVAKAQRGRPGRT
jgi:hypothetical protein